MATKLNFNGKIPRKVIRSHTGHAQFLAECSDEPVGYIPRIDDIPSPYRYSPSYSVWKWEAGNELVVIIETSHKVYCVFTIRPDEVKATDEEATEIYISRITVKQEN